MQNNPQQRQQQRPPQPIKVALETEEPEKTGNEWSIMATAVVSQGNRTLDGREVQFFTNGIAYDQPVQTDNNGRAQIDVVGISMDAKRVSIEAQVVGQTARARKIVSFPAKEKGTKSVPAELIVDPRRVGNEINFFILVVDEEKKGVPNARLTIIDGHAVTHPSANEHGEHLHPMNLEINEEREIGIYVSGFGDAGFRRTFKGREED